MTAKSGFIYVVLAKGTNRLKIGWTADSTLGRLQDLQVACPFPLELLAVLPGSMLDERKFHARFRRFRVHGEWFEASTPVLDFILSLSEQGFTHWALAATGRARRSRARRA